MFLRISQNSQESTCARVSFLILKARSGFQNFEKIQAISLYWFAAQQQTSTLRRQEIVFFYVKFHAEFNGLSIFFLKQQEVAKKCQKMFSFQWKPFFLVEAIPFSGNHSLWQKSLLLMEAISFSGNHSFQWKPFLLVETIPLLVETISFSGNHSF